MCGDYYYYSKVEKFFVILGKVYFGFCYIWIGEYYEIVVEGIEGWIVEIIFGWMYNVINIGEGELVVMFWVNEIFD